ncbi:hypothetical protein [Streptacidiphilus sp. PAMC 29251]
MKRIRSFGRFWYDFVVGDDWRIALGVVLVLGVTAGLVQQHLNAWWLPPAAVAVLLARSLRLAVKAKASGRR